MNKFRKGLVAGKFSPLTFGHEALIEYAILHCEQVLILSYSAPEFPKCDRETRERWLNGRFSQQQVVVLDTTTAATAGYHMPENDDGADMHRQFCGDILVNHLGTTVDAVFTSEDYGDGFAAYLTKRFAEQLGTTFEVKHILYDLERQRIPISATKVRGDILGTKSFVSSNVYASLMPKLQILGGESSGKTTLAKALAAELDTAWVSEYGRDVWEKREGDLRYEDMLHIAQTQVKSELILSRRFGNKLLVCDTSPLTTLFYSEQMFKGNAPAELVRLAKRPYDFTVICAPTIPFEQDGTRRDAEFRQRGHRWYIQQMLNSGTSYLAVSGSVEERVAQVRRYVGL